MGGVVSTGQDNDELIDNLKEAEYIKTAKVEQVFRIVDRAHYYLPEARDNAYKDLAWKSGTLHLSAPCIYSEVMEVLDLKDGISFLNLGSGTGYLNTMVGFMIGLYGINHGIEIHEENVKYAEERLKEFKLTAKKFDDLEFCEPTFVQGNCLNIAPDNRRYDRVYCGAACPSDLKSTIQNLIKVDGILVMPVGDQLLKVKRISETEFTADNVLPVSFASLHVPVTTKEPADIIIMPEVNPISLQNQCASVVRKSIRKNFCFDFPLSKDMDSKQSKRLAAARLFHQEDVRLPLNFLPTAERLMMMGAFGQSDESINSADDQADEFFLDVELRRHARERQRAEQRRRRERNRGNTDEVDSNFSEDEEMNDLDLEESHITGNQTDSSNDRSKSVSEYIESMESEDGVVADDERDDEEEFDVKSDGSSAVKGLVNKSNYLSLEKSSCSSSNIRCSCDSCPEDNSDVGKVATSDKNAGYSSKENGKIQPKPALSLSSDEGEELVTTSGSSSGPIQVVTSSFPRGHKSSYSTSAEASETSGFGSLGDDPFHIGGSHQSQSVFLDRTDDREDDDIADLTLSDASEQKSPLPKSPCHAGQGSNFVQSKIIEEEDMDENENDDDSINDPEITTGEEDVSSSEYEGDNERKGKAKCSLSEPRGPDFTAFLKSKVETLPIPNTLKMFILRYR